jgi:hypothetical protein
MIHKKFNQFLNEEILLENLIMESTLNFSPNFASILNSLKDDDRVAREILSAFQSGKDAEYTANYIDLTKDRKDYVEYIPQNKAERILSETQEIWTITNTSVLLTFNRDEDGEFKNLSTFRRLNYTPTEVDISNKVSSGQICKISARCINPSKKEYVLITIGKLEGKDFIPSDVQKVINITGLTPFDNRYDRLWTEQRATFKVGKFAKSIFKVLNINHTEQEIEVFTNRYKAAWDIFNQAFAKFDVVRGDKIAFWYKSANYESQQGQLGNSCMKEKGPDYFKIYTENPEVCQMVILYDNNGKISDGKYVSDKIRGRAIVWTLSDGTIFVDRIYTNNDSDIELFKQFAQSKGWFYKTYQDSSGNLLLTDGKTRKTDDIYTCNLEKVDFGSYPYVDSMKYLSLNEKCLTNTAINSSERQLVSTSGDWYEVDD